MNSTLMSQFGQSKFDGEKTTIIYQEEQFDPKHYVSVGVSERDVEMYKEVFDLFDVHRSGNLTPNDLRNALEMFGYHPKKHLIYQIISDIDADESGGIDFREFLKIMTDQLRPCDADTEDDYDRVFSYFDMDMKGKDFVQIYRPFSGVFLTRKDT
jgi:Ca2+-binding EF-hand superfamily protein